MLEKFFDEEINEFKGIKIIRDELYFLDKPESLRGVAFPKTSEIFIRELKGSVILHEIIHCLEGDPKTFKAIEEIFSYYSNSTVEDIIENMLMEQLLSNYHPKNWVSETYAIYLQVILLNEFNNDSKKAIDCLLTWVQNITGVGTLLVFEIKTMEVLKTIDELKIID